MSVLHSQYEVEVGRAKPLGAFVDKGGVNFCLFSQNATSVQLYLFDEHDSLEPLQIIDFDPYLNRTFYFWHCYVKDLKAGIHYGYRIDGPHDPAAGHRFQKNKLLIDPYAFGNTNSLWDRRKACGEDENLFSSMRSVVIDINDYDWEDDRPLNRPMSETIIYEINVRGFTESPSSGVKHRGKFAGIVEKVPYLKALGITAIELLPVMEFDETEILRLLVDGTPLTNYWGYSTLSFFAPDSRYCCQPELGAHINEFRDMVKALHKAGIEVILDVVFNHTTEGNQDGPVISFKGIDNSVYYHLVPGQMQYYMNYSGCGNTLNCNHPIVERFILDCLEFWIEEMHVDGFRFDEASVLSRLMDGTPSPMAPTLWNIELSHSLQDSKLIAEAWDAAGLYQIGRFPGYRWAEWNGQFRDDIRRFVAGQEGMVGPVASRIAGSADLYETNRRQPINSINFVTCHDGFTLNDLVSYNGKNNFANGEQNQDGIDENLSWNCGYEGATSDAEIEALRTRQCKNFFSLLFLAQGVPMILGGDEMRRTQRGNNNAYCQDNEISWFDWTLQEKHSDLVRFVSEMVHFRKRHRSLQRNYFFNNACSTRGLCAVTWHGCQLGAPGWDDPASRVLAFTLAGVDSEEEDLHVIFNMSNQDLAFDLPPLSDRRWLRVVDTGKPSPSDILAPGFEEELETSAYQALGRTVVVFVSA